MTMAEGTAKWEQLFQNQLHLGEKIKNFFVNYRKLPCDERIDMVINGITSTWKKIFENHEKNLTIDFENKILPLNCDHNSFSNLEDSMENCKLRASKQINTGSKDSSSASSMYKIVPKDLSNADIPKFDGNPLKWKEFKNIFIEMIHNADISDAQKLFYLKSNLTGQAPSLVTLFDISLDTYKEAWNRITLKYDNERLLTSAIAEKLFYQPVLKEENSEGLINLRDVTKECLVSLNHLNIDVKSCELLIVFLLLKKLDPKSREQFEFTLENSNNNPSLEIFYTFLDRRSKALAGLPKDFKSSKTIYISTKIFAENKNFSPNHKYTNGCFCCKGEAYNLDKCNKFCSWSSKQKFKFVKRSRLCSRCLEKGHYTKEALCLVCNGRHHTAMHFDKSGNVNNSVESGKVVLSLGKNLISINSSFLRIISALIVPSLTKYQLLEIFDNLHYKLKCFDLSDPEFYSPDSIDILLGVEIFPLLLSNKCVDLRIGLPQLIKTVFGLIVMGVFSNKRNNTYGKSLCSLAIDENSEFNFYAPKLWDLEDLDKRMLSVEEDRAVVEFNQNKIKSEEGRFVVKLPKSSLEIKLGDSYNIALKRFYSLEKRFQKDRSLFDQYYSFMNEYFQLVHMEKVCKEDIPKIHYFIPHHAVLKLDSTTTKLRVVFDTSCKTSSNISLNNIFLKGPVVQSELFDLLIRFQFLRYAMSADIEKIYRQILVDKGDRNLQLIFWRNNSSLLISIFRLKTVTYGTTPVPFLATKCLLKLVEECAQTLPLVSKILKQDFYVDDLITEFDDLEQGIQIQKGLINILSNAGFHLTKWCSNNLTILNNVPTSYREIHWSPKSILECVKPLGVIWIPKDYYFSLKCSDSYYELPTTKRTIGSEYGSIFDPLGFEDPFVVRAKMIIKDLWKQRVCPVPDYVVKSWENFRGELRNLKCFKIPRHVLCVDYDRFELHGFADASSKAYGAVMYIRSINCNNLIDIRFLCSKSKVAPLSSFTIHKLELAAAKLLCELMHKLKQCIKYTINGEYFWSDSQVAVWWIQKNPESFEPFVANRVKAIQKYSRSDDWYHIAGSENLAHIISRGSNVKHLVKSELWFYEPLFLQKPEAEWPEINFSSFNIATEAQDELKKMTHVMTLKSGSSFLDRNYHRNLFFILKKIMSFIIRFCNMCKSKSHNNCNKIFHRCVICFKNKGKPRSRTSLIASFKHVGVNYAGSFHIYYKFRGKRTTKAYLGVFVCSAIKAVHLEVVSDLTIEAFLACLKRLVSRKGKLEHTYSDNASNYVGAKRELQNKINKHKKILTTNLLISLLYFILIFPLILGSNLANNTKFDYHPGIYFDGLGEVNMVKDKRQLVSYFNLTNYLSQCSDLAIIVNRANSLCSDVVCSKTIEKLNYKLKKIQELNDLIKQETLLRRITSRHKIGKRSYNAPLNVIGNIANFLFGTLDNRYAEKMEVTLNNIKTNEDRLMLIIKNHTSILYRTVKISQKNNEEIANHIQKLKTETLMLHRSQQRQMVLGNLFDLIILSMIEIRETQLQIHEMMIDFKNGKLNAMLVGSEEFEDHVREVERMLADNYKLPSNHYAELETIAKLAVISGESCLIFQIEIPLMRRENFKLYRMIPVPTYQNGVHMFIKPFENFLAVDVKNQFYYLLSFEEYKECMQFHQIKLCFQTQALHPVNTDNHCEVNLFLGINALIHHCDIRQGIHHQYWIPLHKTNQWIYSVNSEVTTKITCDNEQVQFESYTISGEGIIEINPSCNLDAPNVKIPGRNIIMSKLFLKSIPSVLPSISLSENTTYNNSSVPLVLKLDNLEMISSAIDTIKKEESSTMKPILFEDMPDIYHNISFGISGFIFIICMILLSYIFCCKRHKQQPSVTIATGLPLVRRRFERTSNDLDIEEL